MDDPADLDRPNTNHSDEESVHIKKKKNLILRYFSCFTLGPEREEDKKKNFIMRFLYRECWTDGTLIALKVDIFSGITLAVAQVAPCLAFALMGHGDPLVGLFSSFFLGIIPCIFGGRPGQITAIAGAVVVLYPDLVDQYGYGAACAVSIISGCFMLLPGIFKFAKLVRMLPASLMIGFCNGLALSMVIHQIPSFRDETGEFVTGLRALYTAIICVVSYAIMMLLPYFTNVIPSAFVAVVVGTVIQYACRMNTVTIGHLYQLHGTFPKPQVPDVNWSDGGAISAIMVASILTAIISCVESFMADSKIGQLTETPTNFERESLSLGAAHIINGFFNGMSGCVVYGPCILNIECGSGTRRLSSFICAILMVVFPLALYAVIRIIPMAALSAVLFGVSSKTADYRMLPMIFLQRISLQECAVAIIVTVVTVIENLAIGAASGFAAALVFFMWNMARGRVSMSPLINSAPYSTHLERRQEETVEEQTSMTSLPQSEEEATKDKPPAPEDHSRTNSVFSQREERVEDVAVHIPSSEISDPDDPPTSENQSFLKVNLLDIERDEVFKEIKVLRVKLQGVLFFGTCMSFVDSVMKLLHEHHSEIFLKVTDIIFDFQHGMMTVMDFSACEALQDAAKILTKRGIRTHVQNMDPMSYVCFERCRRYLTEVTEDNNNNTKQFCYVRRIFKRSAELPSENNPIQERASDELHDDVFVRANKSFVLTQEKGEKGVVEPAQNEEVLIQGDPLDTAEVSPPVLTSKEIKLSLEESVKVGFTIFRPHFGISVIVFDTVKGWKQRLALEEEHHSPRCLELGITDVAPFNRQYGDINLKIVLKRIFDRDVPRATNSTEATEVTSAPRTPGPLRRDPPQYFVQVPRFPGQGYAKREHLSSSEWDLIRGSVFRNIFQKDPPQNKRGKFVRRMKKFQVDLFDGFI